MSLNDQAIFASPILKSNPSKISFKTRNASLMTKLKVHKTDTRLSILKNIQPLNLTTVPRELTQINHPSKTKN